MTSSQRLGELPLPPYITQPLADPERYQTVYADRPGSVAAPTAGLHLTPAVLGALAERGHRAGPRRAGRRAWTRSSPSPSTIRPTTRCTASATASTEAVLDSCRATKASGGRVVAIGTTTVRALEAAALGQPGGRTELFIRRPYPWQVVDVLLTNFHLPRTTLLMLVDAFVGPRWRQLYEVALDEGYRFLSFGDAMLLERAA